MKSIKFGYVISIFLSLVACSEEDRDNRTRLGQGGNENLYLDGTPGTTSSSGGSSAPVADPSASDDTWEPRSVSPPVVSSEPSISFSGVASSSSCMTCNLESAEATLDPFDSQTFATLYGSGVRVSASVNCTSTVSGSARRLTATVGPSPNPSSSSVGSSPPPSCLITGTAIPLDCSAQISCESEFLGTGTVGASYYQFNYSAGTEVSVGDGLAISGSTTLSPTTPPTMTVNSMNCETVKNAMRETCKTVLQPFADAAYQSAKTEARNVLLTISATVARSYAPSSRSSSFWSHLGSRACFVAGTKIRKSDGSWVPVESIQQGDLLTSFDPKNQRLRISKVSTTMNRKVEGYLKLKAANFEVSVTSEHPFYIGGKSRKTDELGGFRKAKDLVAGDEIYVEAGGMLKKLTLDTIVPIEKQARVYNLNLSNGPPTYFANGFAVHNKGP